MYVFIYSFIHSLFYKSESLSLTVSIWPTQMDQPADTILTNNIHFDAFPEGYQVKVNAGEKSEDSTMTGVSYSATTATHTVRLMYSLNIDTYRGAIFFKGSRSLQWADGSKVLKDTDKQF